MASIDIPELELERECWKCYGDGVENGAPCGFCHGRGWRLTDDGEKVLNLLRHFGVLVPK
jgi:DnaJ-class molecular chaperone